MKINRDNSLDLSNRQIWMLLIPGSEEGNLTLRFLSPIKVHRMASKSGREMTKVKSGKDKTR
jgi:hypothetical protein